ncbi:MAG: tRNA pseudouridine(55) synthase TruB [Planctomycetia bacterium]|nr:tRNA pseudouridine(55) synthase TruB [Planctomycetia bacterium]
MPIRGLTPSHLCGLVNVHKPSGLTSRATVDVVKRVVRPAKVGHAGTLDPLATGVLVVCVGAATRLIEYVQQLPKRYRATFQLGRSSPTEDVEGDVTVLANAPQPSGEQIVRAAAALTGEILQRPPAYSALKVGGRRAYDLARSGREVALAPRKIVVHAIDVVTYAYPELTLDIRCGSGTYVRSLGRDLAEAVGTAAVMSALVRTEIGPFALTDAWPCENLRSDNMAQWLRPARDAAAALPSVALGAAQVNEVAHGRFVTLDGPDFTSVGELAAIGPDGELVAILRQRGGGRLGPRINLAAASSSLKQRSR